MENQMIERVARAICGASPRDWEIYRGEFEAEARAAIAAMREPTPAMIEAAYSFNSPITVDGSEVGRLRQRHEPAEAWRNTIDAALA